MSKILRKLAVTAVATMALGGTTLAAAGTASADTSYHCRTSSHSVDNPSYGGPYGDNFDFSVKLCAKRSSGVISSYAKISWDGPAWFVNDTSMFDAARFHLQTKRSTSGADPVVKWANTGMESKLEHGDTNGNGSMTTGVIKSSAGSSRYLSDGYIQLNWNEDGKRYRTTYFAASPTV
ncbi:hypothetical protein [Streptomyces sp. NBC_01361]|uniref:hypothetical protein n=1 Tax=Streptomyces sp. NBC_01361 TaxID=2903838 RepID=UPI002E3316D3|nr:hypothetical protein [Streptomyces sp. NBC_01361]